jgi:hypothetical protein
MPMKTSMMINGCGKESFMGGKLAIVSRITGIIYQFKFCKNPHQFVGFKAIDRDGNVGETQFKVTVLDETVPSIGNLSRMKVTLAKDEIYILPDLRLTTDATDNCAVVEYLQIPDQGTIYNTAGTYSILLMAIDGSGNAGERSSTLSIRQSINNKLQNRDDLSEINTLTDEQESLGKPESNSIKIYPNPSIDHTNISVILWEPSAVEIKIFDTAGRFVFSEQSVQEESFVRSIPMNGLSNGLYYVVVKINQQYLQGR